MLSRLPLGRPQPDITKFISVLEGKATSDVPPLVEYLVDETVMKPIMTGLLDRSWVDEGSERESLQPYLYGQRIAVLGGLDVNILASSTPEAARQKTRDLMETCGRIGRYAVGSGNSIPSYVPVANYLAMIDEAQTR
jgi:hypothetical protein